MLNNKELKPGKDRSNVVPPAGCSSECFNEHAAAENRNFLSLFCCK